MSWSEREAGRMAVGDPDKEIKEEEEEEDVVAAAFVGS